MAIFNLKPENITNLELKLDGKIPVNRDELLALANSWGRENWFYSSDKDSNEIIVKFCEENKKYDLSKLDVSLIKNFNDIFRYSNFNGDINSWDVSNGTSMFGMFCEAEKFNQNINNWNTSNVTFMTYMFANTKNFNSPLDKWDTSKVISMYHMFYKTKEFNQNLNSWNISNVINTSYMFEGSKEFNQPVLWDLSKVESCDYMFYEAKAFLNKFNNGIELRKRTNNIKEWLKNNRDRMIAFDVEHSKGKELDDFLLDFNIIDSANLNGLHDVIVSKKLNGLHNREIDDDNI